VNKNKSEKINQHAENSEEAENGSDYRSWCRNGLRSFMHEDDDDKVYATNCLYFDDC
jgi:hypothetical protein